MTNREPPVTDTAPQPASEPQVASGAPDTEHARREPTRWLDPVETRAWRGLLGTNARLLAVLDEDLQADQGISLADYDVLVALSEAPQRRLRMAELAQAVYLSPSGLTRRVDSLVRRQMVDKVPCEDDRRGSYTVLTPAGMAQLVRAAPDHVAHVRRHLLDRLDRRQVELLADVLDVLSRPEPHPVGGEGQGGRRRPRHRRFGSAPASRRPPTADPHPTAGP